VALHFESPGLHSALAALMAYGFLGSPSKRTTCRSSKEVILLYQALVRPQQEHCAQFSAPRWVCLPLRRKSPGNLISIFCHQKGRHREDQVIIPQRETAKGQEAMLKSYNIGNSNWIKQEQRKILLKLVKY